MSLVQIKELDEKLKNEIYPSIWELNNRFQVETKKTSYSPEVIEEFMVLSKGIDSYTMVLSKAIASALKGPKSFNPIFNSQKQLISQLEKIINRVKEEQPDSPLISEYSKALLSNIPKFGILKEIKAYLDYPKSKKKFNKWKKKGWVILDFVPFINIENLKEEFNKKLEELING